MSEAAPHPDIIESNKSRIEILMVLMVPGISMLGVGKNALILFLVIFGITFGNYLCEIWTGAPRKRQDPGAPEKNHKYGNSLNLMLVNSVNYLPYIPKLPNFY